jgi:hypothetical protein
MPCGQQKWKSGTPSLPIDLANVVPPTLYRYSKWRPGFKLSAQKRAATGAHRQQNACGTVCHPVDAPTWVCICYPLLSHNTLFRDSGVAHQRRWETWVRAERTVNGWTGGHGGWSILTSPTPVGTNEPRESCLEVQPAGNQNSKPLQPLELSRSRDGGMVEISVAQMQTGRSVAHTMWGSEE